VNVVVGIGALLVATAPLAGQAAKERLRVGTYDSRAIAVAYASSGQHRQEITKLRTEFEQAKAAQDQKRTKELEAQGLARQARLHQQGFSTGSVINIMDKIKPDLAAVAKEAGVVMIVSKWEAVYADQSLEYVDVTMPLVMKFKPNEQTLKWVDSLRAQAPIPLEELPPDDRDY
jgi:hypothetical protein